MMTHSSFVPVLIDLPEYLIGNNVHKNEDISIENKHQDKVKYTRT